MGICEQLIAFERRQGKRPNVLQHAALARGFKEHRRFYVDGLRLVEETKPRNALELGRWLRIGFQSVLRGVTWLIRRAIRGGENHVGR